MGAHSRRRRSWSCPPAAAAATLCAALRPPPPARKQERAAPPAPPAAAAQGPRPRAQPAAIPSSSSCCCCSPPRAHTRKTHGTAAAGPPPLPGPRGGGGRAPRAALARSCAVAAWLRGCGAPPPAPTAQPGPALRCAHTHRRNPRAESYRSCPLWPLQPRASPAGAERRRGASAKGERAPGSAAPARRGERDSQLGPAEGKRSGPHPCTPSRCHSGNGRTPPCSPNHPFCHRGETLPPSFPVGVCLGKRGGECPNQSLENCVPHPSCPILSQHGQGSSLPPRISRSTRRLPGSSHFLPLLPQARGAERRHPTSAWPGSRKPAPSTGWGAVSLPPPLSRNGGRPDEVSPCPPPIRPCRAPEVRALCPDEGHPREPLPPVPHGGGRGSCPTPPRRRRRGSRLTAAAVPPANAAPPRTGAAPGVPPALHKAAGEARGARAHPQPRRGRGGVREPLPGSVPSPAAAASADLRFVR